MSEQAAAAVKPNAINEELTVVGVGASAGGLEALEHFFRAMPTDSGMAFVIIQHLSPDFKSLMDELLARFTSMAIVRVEMPTEVRANTIYLLPPRKDMEMAAGRLVLMDRAIDHQPNMPITRFFRSLARDRKAKAVGIVLSGTGSDGSMGVADIYDAGGLVLVQTVESSKFDGMPRSAIATGFAHGVLTPEEMPAVLLRHVADPGAMQNAVTGAKVGNGEDLSLLFERIREAYGIDFSLYKPATITRRIERRLVLGNFDSVKEYCETLFRDPVELDLLYKDLLIGVTRFFRDAEAFEIMREKIIPQIVQVVAPEEDIRVWVPACATGEEAYSLAILFLQELERHHREPNLKIFATDLHRNSLRIVAEGTYSEESLEAMPEPIREKYFNREPDGRFRVLPKLRKVLLVSPHNLIRDVPFNRIDLVSCRNLLIYFQPVAQTRALTAFHFALKTRGFLFLGPSESIGELERDFEPLDRTWKVYRKITDTRLPLELRKPTMGLNVIPRGTAIADARMSRIHDQLLSRYMPPGVLVNEKREVIHLFGQANRVLHPPEGRVNLDVVSMCEGELRMALSSLIQASLKRKERVEMQRVRVTTGADTVMMHVVAEPFYDKPTSSEFVLLLFLAGKPGGETSQSSQELEIEAEVNDHVESLEAELKDTRESLQTMVEELETTNEELQASNEELLASNEELQSTNEELHSVNEELYSVNAEHEQKIRELATLTADLRNLMAESQAGIIFTDKQKYVRLYTPGAVLLLNLLPQDIGRPIAHITPRVKDDDIFEDIEKVSTVGQSISKQVTAPDGRHFLRRIAPYQDSDKQVAGLVIAFVDITERVKAEAAVRESLKRVEEISFALNQHAVVSITDPQGAIIFANDKFCEISKYAREELLGQNHRIVKSGFHSREFMQELWTTISQGQVWQGELKNRAKDGTYYWVAATIVPFLNEAGTPRQYVAIRTDISERIRAEEQIRTALKEVLDLKTALDEHAIVAITDPQGKITYVNDKFCAISKYSREELIGQDHRIVNSGHHPPAFIRELWNTIGKGRVWHGVIKNKAKDGTIYWVDTTIVPFLDEQGNPRQYVAIRADVTELLEVEENLKISVEEKEVLLREIHHRVKNNLQVVISILQLQSSKFNDVKYRKMFAECQNQVQSMAMIHEKLYRSRNLGAINFGEHVQSLSAMVFRSYGYQAKKIQLEVMAEPVALDIDKAIPASLILNELVSNSLKHGFGKKESGKIAVTFRQEPADNLLLEVKDDGVGLPAGLDIKKCESLGFSMIEGLARQLRGQLKVDSEAGACFRITFPNPNLQADESGRSE